MVFNRDGFENFLFQQFPFLRASPLPLYVFDALASTNQTLWQLLEGGSNCPAAAIAAQQTAGRGQWGRQWQSSPGGLYLSLALAPNLSASESFHLTLCSAYGIASQLRRHGVPVALKWPNDLLLEGRKLGGIKIETRIQASIIARAIIGIGINWHNPVPQVGINLQSFPQIDSLEQLAAIAIGGTLSTYQQYQRDGIEPILASYVSVLDSLGQKISVDGCPGTIVGVESTGKLQIRLHSEGASTEICQDTGTISLWPGTISLGYDDSNVARTPHAQ
ncbi:MAG: biotin--[acetyl-CoA-carboxylase] ligase [Cyanobacteriota bacterium]|nr:biotin--[acetyl-CoA-carboxylase] ligase [Cyanobacteriota bacterium]